MKTVSKFIKNPELIEAISWTGDNKKEVFEFLDSEYLGKYTDTIKREKFIFDHSNQNELFVVVTKNGEVNLKMNDYLIKDENGDIEVYDEMTFVENFVPIDRNGFLNIEGNKNHKKLLKNISSSNTKNDFDKLLKSKSNVNNDFQKSLIETYGYDDETVDVLEMINKNILKSEAHI